jgi:hypothetical protein
MFFSFFYYSCTVLGESYIKNVIETIQEEQEIEKGDEEEERYLKKKMFPMKETKINGDLGESIFEAAASEEDQQQLNHKTEIPTEEIMSNNEVFKDYIEIQVQIILSNEEIKAMWEEYKQYVDEKVFTELQDTTFCR